MRLNRFFSDKRALIATGFLGCMGLWLALLGTQYLAAHKKIADSGTAGLAGVFGGLNMFASESEAKLASVALRVANSPSLDGVVQSQATERKMTKKGSLRLRVSDLTGFLDTGSRLAADLGGYVVRATRSDAAWSDSVLIICIPANRFDDAMQRLQKTASKVEESTTETADVTKQYVDFESTLRNYRAEEDQYLAILKQAHKVDDVVLVTEKLIDVRGRIEQTQGDFKFLQHEIAMSTIGVAVRSDTPQVSPGVRWQPAASVKQAYNDMLRDLPDPDEE